MKIQNPKSKIQNPLSSFTLVELMVVLAIIAMLAGLVLYGVGRTRAKAVMIQCQNNLREHGVYLAQVMLTKQATADKTDSTVFGGVSRIDGGGGKFIILDGDGRERAWSLDDLKRSHGEDIRGFYEGTDGKTLSSSGAGYGDYLDFEIPSEVRFCPAVDHKALADTNSYDFKGYGVTVTVDSDYWDGHSVVTTNTRAIDGCLAKTTYALNTRNISPNSIAFVDWNAAEGWGTQKWGDESIWYGYLYHTTWQFNNSRKGIVRGAYKGTTNWWHTEVGFHHLGGANYVNWGGQGGWVHSNDINLSYFQP